MTMKLSNALKSYYVPLRSQPYITSHSAFCQYWSSASLLIKEFYLSFM